MKIKFNNQKKFIQLRNCGIYNDKVRLYGEKLPENLSGFSIYEDDEETLVKDCSDHIYKWNIYTDYEDGIMLTSSETERERKPNPNAEPPREVVDPLSNEELTECVADLMYEVSLNELGM